MVPLDLDPHTPRVVGSHSKHAYGPLSCSQLGQLTELLGCRYRVPADSKSRLSFIVAAQDAKLVSFGISEHHPPCAVRVSSVINAFGSELADSGSAPPHDFRRCAVQIVSTRKGRYRVARFVLTASLCGGLSPTGDRESGQPSELHLAQHGSPSHLVRGLQNSASRNSGSRSFMQPKVAHCSQLTLRVGRTVRSDRGRDIERRHATIATHRIFSQGSKFGRSP
jgi:hypothetical protein